MESDSEEENEYYCKKKTKLKNILKDSEVSITLSDILNLIDGINETSGRILILTSNHYEDLDPALIRPGRIDIHIKMDNCSKQMIQDIYTHYYKQDIDNSILNKIQDYKISPAKFTNLLFSSISSEEFYKNLLTTFDGRKDTIEDKN